MNITGMLPSDKLPIFFSKPNFTFRHTVGRSIPVIFISMIWVGLHLELLQILSEGPLLKFACIFQAMWSLALSLIKKYSIFF